jgi:hypothetical protein
LALFPQLLEKLLGIQQGPPVEFSGGLLFQFIEERLELVLTEALSRLTFSFELLFELGQRRQLIEPLFAQLLRPFGRIRSIQEIPCCFQFGFQIPKVLLALSGRR